MLGNSKIISIFRIPVLVQERGAHQFNYQASGGYFFKRECLAVKVELPGSKGMRVHAIVGCLSFSPVKTVLESSGPQ